MTIVAVVYHSATGRTKALAEAVAEGAREVEGTTVHLLSVVDEDAAAPGRIHTVLAGADAIIFGCPTYMGSASAQFKAFMDSTSAVWALQGWRDKIAGAFTHSAALSGDKLGTLTQLAVFAAQHGMIWVGLGLPPTYAGLETADAEDTNRLGSHLGAMAQSRPGGGAVPLGDRKTASLLGRRVAEATRRWNRRGYSPSQIPSVPRHDTARGWIFPPSARNTQTTLPRGIVRTSLREIVARPERFEHHLVVCASVDNVQLEITVASEPLYFAHINLSDEYALALPSGDELVDRFPLRTFLSDPLTGEDVGRYNHRVGDLVLHPDGYLHWPGRLRAPYEPFDFPPGMRRAGLSLVVCATKPTPPSPATLSTPNDRDADVKAYVEPAPRMMLASMRGAPGVLGAIGRTTLSLVELPEAIAPEHGGWVVILEAAPNSGFGHHACDLLRVEAGTKLEGAGIVRALVLASSAVGPDPVPPSWKETPKPAFRPFEDEAAGTLPFETNGLTATAHETSPQLVTIKIGSEAAHVPRYWLARMLFRVGLHGLRLGYIETYEGFFIDDRGLGPVLFGIRIDALRHSVSVPRKDAIAIASRLYRAVAPAGYVERPA